MSNLIGTDISFWEDDPATPQKHIDFQKMKSAGAGFCFIKVGQRNFIDPTFRLNWQNSKGILPRGGFWYYDNREKPIAQAELWAETMNGDFGELPLYADFEDDASGQYGGWQNYKIFLERIKKLAITKEIGIYTGYYFWKDDVHVPLIEQPYFAQFPLWIANYNPNAFPLIPPPWTTWLFWQYSENGSSTVYGTEGSVDLNYFNGDQQAFNVRFGLDAPNVRVKDVESHTTPFEGVTLHRIFRAGSWCSVSVIVHNNKKFQVTPFDMRTTSQCAKDLGAQLVINGGGFTPTRAIGLHVAEGTQYQAQLEYEPFCNFAPNDVPSIEYYDSHITRFNSLAGKRMIVENGQVSLNNSPAWYEVHPRTLIGVDAQGRSVWATVDGRQSPYSVGMDLFQSALLMMEFGCVRAIDLDGGGSTTFVMQEKGAYNVLNYPIDNGVVGKERQVGTHIAMFIEGEVIPPPAGETMDKGVAKVVTNVKVMSGSNPSPIPTLAVGDTVYGIAGATDMTEITHIHRANGSVDWLASKCKATLPNLTVTRNVTHTDEVIPTPTPVVYPPFIFLQLPDANGVLQPGKFYDVRI